MNEIDDLLLPYSFDISIFDHLENPALIEHINRVGIIFFSRKKNMDRSSQIGREWTPIHGIKKANIKNVLKIYFQGFSTV